MAKNINKRYGFHSIESIMNNNPHTIKSSLYPPPEMIREFIN